MSSIIDSSKVEKNNIQKYHFKVISSDLSKQEDNAFEPMVQPPPKEEVISHESLDVKEKPKEKKEEPKKEKDEQQSTFVEELMKKTDELSSNVIKMQMQMEAQQSDFEKRLQEERQRAKDEGFEDGKKKAHESFDKELESLRSKFTSSISKVEKVEEKFEQKLVEIEHNLSNVAIDIAKEVINIEVENRSFEIAKALSKTLIEQIKDATHIEIKVSMDDFDFVSSAFKGSKNIEIIADDAIARGGVILLSDIGNIDGDLDVRLQKVKELLIDHKE